MSWRPTPEPTETPVPEPVEPEVEAILTPRDRDLGGFVVRRLRRMPDRRDAPREDIAAPGPDELLLPLEHLFGSEPA